MRQLASKRPTRRSGAKGTPSRLLGSLGGPNDNDYRFQLDRPYTLVPNPPGIVPRALNLTPMSRPGGYPGRGSDWSGRAARRHGESEYRPEARSITHSAARAPAP